VSAYDERPWLSLYAGGRPHEIELEHGSILAAFGQTAASYPDKPAIVYFDTAISFRELDLLSDALAAGLAEHGFKPGDRLGIYLQNVPQFVIAVLATWKAGGVVVSISPMLKHKELSAQLADSGASALVTFESLWGEVARDVVGDTDVRIAITTSELEFLDEPRRYSRAHGETATATRSISRS
jgi:long-chain acyl-CoA synthetase